MLHQCQPRCGVRQVWTESAPSAAGLFRSLFRPPSLLCGSRGERSVQGGGERAGVWPGGPLDTDSVIVHSCHTTPTPTPSLYPPPPPPLFGRPHLKGIPCYPASLMKSDTRPEDLISSETGPLPPLFCLLLLTAVAHTELQ